MKTPFRPFQVTNENRKKKKRKIKNLWEINGSRGDILLNLAGNFSRKKMLQKPYNFFKRCNVI